MNTELINMKHWKPFTNWCISPTETLLFRFIANHVAWTLLIGSFSIDNGYGSENVTFQMNQRFSNSIAFILIS